MSKLILYFYSPEVARNVQRCRILWVCRGSERS